MLDRLLLRWHAHRHRNGRLLDHYRSDHSHDYASCYTHDVCRGHLYRRDRWAINRRTGNPGPFKLA